MANDTFGGMYEKAKASGALGGNPIPAGDYELEITNVNASKTAAGEDRGGILVKVVGPPEDADMGRANWLNLSFTEKAYPISIRTMKAFGLTDEFIAGSATLAEALAPLVGVKLDASVTVRRWGKDDERVDNDVKVNAVLRPPVLPAVEDAPEPGEDEEPF